MKILLTGGGTGGHFYPVIAVAENIRELSKEMKLLDPKIYYMAPDQYDKRALFDNQIIFKRNTAGKRRLYFSIWNLVDLFKISIGVLTAIWQMFLIFPDVVFTKGGYGSFPTLLAAKFFGIPVVVHESDTVPGRVNIWAGKFAKKIAISYPEAAKHFPKDKVALTGNPIRKELMKSAKSGAREFLDLESDDPIILVLGGSQGAEVINEVILSALPKLLNKYQVIHQTGVKNIDYVKRTAGVVLKDSKKLESRYKPFAYLDVLAMKMSAGATDIVISRAGSSIFEIALWGIPSILIPIPESISRDQRTNAFTYSATGAAVVIEERNLTPGVLASEVERITSNVALKESMSKAARDFSHDDAGRKIAKQLINISLKHEI
jgi:UDP-N-acetylglucosamine--N-acetylmuramyl-(pentapeptide) pyrophosphoryl-undecaprenol N-acetylglucosamine transferase